MAASRFDADVGASGCGSSSQVLDKLGENPGDPWKILWEVGSDARGLAPRGSMRVGLGHECLREDLESCGLRSGRSCRAIRQGLCQWRTDCGYVL